MKAIKFSIIAFVLLLSVQFAKAQSISIGATFGGGYYHPHNRVVVAAGYPAYGYCARPAYYGYPRPVYYGGPVYYRHAYGRPVYYRGYRHYRRW